MKKSEVIQLIKDNQKADGIKKWELSNRSSLKSYGVGITQLRKISKQIGRDHNLAQQLWNSNIYEAKILGMLIDDPKQITRDQAEAQVESLHGGLLSHVFSSCGATLAKAPFVVDVVEDWLEHEDKIRRRCGWGLLYEVSKFKGKKAPDETYFVSKVNLFHKNFEQEKDYWAREAMKLALMGIGKRSKKLNKVAVKYARAASKLETEKNPKNGCEPLDVLKHLKSEYLTKKLGL